MPTEEDVRTAERDLDNMKDELKQEIDEQAEERKRAVDGGTNTDRSDKIGILGL